jgi:hypothetical protein
MFQEMKNDDRILNTCLSLNKLCASREEPNGPLKPSEYKVHFIIFMFLLATCEPESRRNICFTLAAIQNRKSSNNLKYENFDLNRGQEDTS